MRIEIITNRPEETLNEKDKYEDLMHYLSYSVNLITKDELKGYVQKIRDELNNYKALKKEYLEKKKEKESLETEKTRLDLIVEILDIIKNLNRKNQIVGQKTRESIIKLLDSLENKTLEDLVKLRQKLSAVLNQLV